MPVQGIDKLLRGLDDLVDLDPQDLEFRLSNLKSEAEVLQLKIAVLDQLLARSRRRHRREQPADTEPAPTVPNGHRSSTWKRDATLSLIQRDPAKTWTAADVRDRLIAEGVMTGDEGTPTRLLLRRLSERGDLEKVGQASYRLAGHDPGPSRLLPEDP